MFTSALCIIFLQKITPRILLYYLHTLFYSHTHIHTYTQLHTLSLSQSFIYPEVLAYGNRVCLFLQILSSLFAYIFCKWYNSHYFYETFISLFVLHHFRPLCFSFLIFYYGFWYMLRALNLYYFAIFSFCFSNIVSKFAKEVHVFFSWGFFFVLNFLSYSFHIEIKM